MILLGSFFICLSVEFEFSIADCVKYGSCADEYYPVIWGHDVVEYFSLKDGSSPVMGEDDFTVEHAGYQFLFKNEENMNSFTANPDKYIPRCGGFCAYAVACHGGEGACINNGAIAVNSTDGWVIYNNKLYLLGNNIKSKMLANTTLFELAEYNWKLWYPEGKRYNTDAFWPIANSEGDSTCRTCGFESGSSNANKLARNRKFFLSRSGAVYGLSPKFAQPFPHSITSWHAERKRLLSSPLQPASDSISPLSLSPLSSSPLSDPLSSSPLSDPLSSSSSSSSSEPSNPSNPSNPSSPDLLSVISSSEPTLPDPNPSEI